MAKSTSAPAPLPGATPSATLAPSSFLDTTKPNIARAFDYIAGGSSYFEVDRAAAEQMLAEFPPLRKLVRLRKSFAFEAVQHLAHVEGFNQFLDLGSGIPSGDAPHQLVPDSTFIYSDINPVAVNHGKYLFDALERVTYLNGDGRTIGSLLAHEEVKGRIRFDEKLAVGLNNIPVFLTEAELKRLAKTLHDRLAVGSQLFLLLQTRAQDAQTDKVEVLEGKLRRIGIPIRYMPLDKVYASFEPWQPQLRETAVKFMGLPADFLDDGELKGAGLVHYALFLVKK